MKRRTRLTLAFALITVLAIAAPPVIAEFGIERLTARKTETAAAGGPEAGEEIRLLDHFPLGAGIRWKYRSNLGEVESRVVVEGDRITIDSRSRPLDIVQRYLLAPEGILLTEAESHTFLISNRRTYHPPLQRFPDRIAVGGTWEWEGREVLDRKKIIESRMTGKVAEREMVAVPAGVFDCLKVTVETVSDDGTVSSSTQWLASGVGIVKAEIDVQAGGLTGLIISLLGFESYSLELLEMTGPDGVIIHPGGADPDSAADPDGPFNRTD